MSACALGIGGRSEESGARVGTGGFCGHRRTFPGLILLAALLGAGPAMALDGSQPAGAEKIPLKIFKSAQQALQMGIDEYRSGDAKSSVEALKYAAAGGQSLAQWKLGRMYAQGDGVPHDDLKAYEYYNELVDSYNEDDYGRRDISAVSSAFVAVGVYCLNGIAETAIKADPERARDMFQFAATNFGDSDAQYNLARMFLDGTGGLQRDTMRAARWLMLAAEKNHRPAQAVLGNLLFVGDGVPRQRARGLMWLTIAKGGAHIPADDWIRDLYTKDYAAADDNDRQLAVILFDARTRMIASMTAAPVRGDAPQPLSPVPPGMIPVTERRAVDLAAPQQ
jgi:TPR repeat protein